MIPDKKRKFIPLFLLLHFLAVCSLFIIYKDRSYYGFSSEIRVKDFKMYTHLGDIFTNKELSSHFHYMFFGYLHCTEICAKGIQRLTKISNSHSDSDVRFVFVSLDPERDTREKLSTFIDSRDKRFFGLRNDNLQELENFIGYFRVQYSKEVSFFSKKNYDLHHSSFVILLHPSLKNLLYYPEGLEDIEKIKKDLEKFRQ